MGYLSPDKYYKVPRMDEIAKCCPPAWAVDSEDPEGKLWTLVQQLVTTESKATLKEVQKLLRDRFVYQNPMTPTTLSITPLCMYAWTPIKDHGAAVEFDVPLDHLPALLPILVHSERITGRGRWSGNLPPEWPDGQLPDIPFVAEYAEERHGKLQKGAQLKYSAHVLAELISEGVIKPKGV